MREYDRILVCRLILCHIFLYKFVTLNGLICNWCRGHRVGAKVTIHTHTHMRGVGQSPLGP